MHSLSYLNREKILAIRELASQQGRGRCDREIVCSVSEALYAHAGRTGFEYCFTRYALELSYRLLYDEDVAVRNISRAALLYFLESDDFIAEKDGAIGLEDDYYVLSLAIQEIETQTGESSSYSGPALISQHRDLVMERLAEFVKRPAYTDDQLIEGAQRFVDQLRPIALSGFFGRFVRSIERLNDIMAHGDCALKTWARAGLCYLIEQDDVIPDGLGLVGFLDDRFAVFEALHQCGGWDDAMFRSLDDSVGQWPFLLRTVLSDSGGDRELSEFTLLNCTMVQQTFDDRASLRWLSLPRTGAAPTMLAILSSIGRMSDLEYSGNAWLVENVKVHLDGDTKHVYLYVGVRTREGREEFGLVHKLHPNGRPRALVWLPTIPENLNRLSPAPPGRKVRGVQPTIIQSSNASIRPIDRLLHTHLAMDAHIGDRPTVLISRPSLVQSWAGNVSLYGERLTELLPMASLARDRTFRWFSRRWEGYRVPSILVVADPLEAVDWLEECGRQASVIVDVSSLRRDQLEDLAHFNHTETPVLAISADSDIEAIDYARRRGCEITGWSDAELSDLVLRHSNHTQGPLLEYERSVASGVTARERMHLVESREAEAAWFALKSLDDVIGKTTSDETTRTLAVGWSLFLSLCRWPLPIEGKSSLESHVSQKLEMLRSNKDSFVPARVLTATHEAADHLADLLSALQRENPKFERLRQIAEGAPTLILVGQRDIGDAQQIVSALDGSLPIKVQDWRSLEPGSVDRVIVPGWYRSEVMHRLLDPPIAPEVEVLGYAFESKNLDQLKQRRSRRHFTRSMTGMPSSEPEPWIGPEPDNGDSLEPEESIERFDRLVRMYARMRAEQRLSEADMANTVQAEFILFEDGSYIWATEFARLRRVNHLFSGEIEDNSELEEVYPRDLHVGDCLLFHTGSDSDAIRVEADKILTNASDVRATAHLWQASMLDFLESKGTMEQLISRMRESGCRLKESTIKGWLEDSDIIAPRAYDDIRHIASATKGTLFTERVEECIDAVSAVRSACAKASNVLARRVIDALIEREQIVRGSVLDGDIDECLRIVRVAAIDEERSSVPIKDAGRLIQDVVS